MTGFTLYELNKIAELIRAVDAFNPNNHAGGASKALEAEVRFWREGDVVAAIEDFDDGGPKFVSKETPE